MTNTASPFATEREADKLHRKWRSALTRASINTPEDQGYENAWDFEAKAKRTLIEFVDANSLAGTSIDPRLEETA